jgi:hydroxymethylbilane synthase
VELVIIQTAGDQVRDVPLASMGGEGVFTREIQRALLAGEVDVAVHSLKDLPTQAVAGLVLAAVPPRGPTGDVLVSRRHRSFEDLPRGAVLATSSLRRQSQVRHRRPDLQLTDIRGNIDTRLRKLAEQHLDGVILALAGLERLGLEHDVTEVLDPTWMLPAVGQGALGLEGRADDPATLALLAKVDDPNTRQRILAERMMLRTLGGGCTVPVGARTTVAGDRLTLHGAVLAPDGSRRIEARGEGPLNQAEQLGHQLAQELLAQGASELLPEK